jgi:hypothetical protein
MVSPLIIEADGRMSPLQYGFAREYGLGNLHEVSLADAAGSWRRSVLPKFRDLCRRVHEEAVRQENDLPFFNWYEMIFNESHTRAAA